MQALGPHDINRAVAAFPQKPPGQPQAEGSNAGVKRKRDGPQIDYTSKDRPYPSWPYFLAASEQIIIDFPMYYKNDIRRVLEINRRLYAPTYMALCDSPVGVRRVARPRAAPKGKNKVYSDPEFQAEFDWVHNVWKLDYDENAAGMKKQKTLVPLASPVKHAPAVPDVGFNEGPFGPSYAMAEQSIKIECGCCFDDQCSFITMVQCKEGHLFCRDCVSAQAGTAVGARQRDILCMDGSGCKQPFPSSELQKCLDSRTFNLWQKIVQAEDIAAAELEGIEYCPECDFGMIFEVGLDVAPLLKCLRHDCGLVTCRRCRKPDHTGRPCKTEEDAKLKAEHAVEEAMTQALLRECPGCRVPFIKSDGCNKIRCQNSRCAIFSCYLCRQPLPRENPYDHFERDRFTVSNKCKLWDATGRGDNPQQRHAEEVAEAERYAREQYQAQGRGM